MLGGQWKLNGSNPTETIQRLILGGHFLQIPQGLAEVRSAHGYLIHQALSFVWSASPVHEILSPLNMAQIMAQSKAFQHSSPTALVGQTSISCTVMPLYLGALCCLTSSLCIPSAD